MAKRDGGRAARKQKKIESIDIRREREWQKKVKRAEKEPEKPESIGVLTTRDLMKKSERPTKKQKKTEFIGIRLSHDLREKLEEAAKEASRNLSGEEAIAKEASRTLSAKEAKRILSDAIKAERTLRAKEARQTLRAIKARGTLSGEIAVRLEHSFREQAIMGGAQGYSLVMGLAARFLHAGHEAGESLFHQTATADEPAATQTATADERMAALKVATDRWMANSFCFDHALTEAVMFLLDRRPNNTQDSAIYWVKGLELQIKNRRNQQDPTFYNFKFPEGPKS